MVEDADLFARYQVTLSNALGYDPITLPQAPNGYPPPRWGPGGVKPLPTLGLDR